LILLDTHIWVWWVNGSPQLTSDQRQHIESNESSGLGVSVVSCWEVAKLVEVNRLALNCAVTEWVQTALAYPGIRLLYLTPRIAIESTRLPQPFHRDPADQMIVATARIRRCPLLTADERIRQYPHVKTLS